jgi:hypothetical protein
LPGLEPALGFRIFNDLARDAVLLRKARVEILELGEDAAVYVPGQAA